MCVIQRIRQLNMSVEELHGWWTSNLQSARLLGSCVSFTFALLSCVVKGLHVAHKEWSDILNILDCCLTAYFAFEMAIKARAQGKCFFKGGWNQYDSLILIAEIVHYVLAAYGIHDIVCHAISPMRLINRERKLRSLVSVLLTIKSLLAYILLVLFSIISIFALAAVQLWREMPPVNNGATSFSNIGYAWITIFQVVTLEGWTSTMHFVADARGFHWFFVFIIIAVMGHIIVINVCTVVIATQFTEAMETVEQNEGADLPSMKLLMCNLIKCLTWLVTQCIRILRHSKTNLIGSKHHKRGALTSSILWKWIKKKLQKMVCHRIFIVGIDIVIFLNFVTMGAVHHGQPALMTRVIHICNVIFNGIFVAEMVIKVMALSLQYFKDKDNIVDFSIVVVRLANLFPNAKQQLLVLRRSVDKAATLCVLMLFVIFIFSILGMQIFQNQFTFTSANGDIIIDRKNFDSLYWAMITVFEILTLDDWDLVLYNAMASTSPWTALYFITLIVFGVHLLLNLLIGIVVENFHSLAPAEKDKDSHSSVATHENVSIEVSVPPERDSAAEMEKRNLFQRVLHWFRKHEDWSFYVLPPQNRFRKFLLHLISQKWFDQVILFFIVLTALTIAAERPAIQPDSVERQFLEFSSIGFTGVFLLEMIIKVMALGLVFGKKSYCRSLWNLIDGLVVVLSMVHISIRRKAPKEGHRMNIIQVLRLLRAFRPLRIIKRFSKLKLIVETLIRSLKPMRDITVISILFFIMYGIVGVQLFNGKFHHCVGADTRNITHKTDCLLAGYHWIRKTFNFDNLFEALLSVFVMYSKDGWMRIMYEGLDAVGVDQQPMRNYNEWMVLYFLSFMVLSIFLLDLFIGVMVEASHRTQQKQQLILQRTKKATRQKSQDKAGGEGSRSIKIVDICMKLLVIFYTVILSVTHHNQPEYLKKLADYSLLVITGVLILEVILKMIVFGFTKFRQNSWNQFDVLWLVLYFIFHITNIPLSPNILGIFLVIRVAEVLKSKKFLVLLTTIIGTLSQLGSLAMLFFFIFFIYAVLGVELFGELECTQDYPCEILSSYTNFHHFGMALLVLFQVTTGDEWSKLLKDTIRECHPQHAGCDSYLSWASPIYFSSFVLIAHFTLINLVVATAMQALKDSKGNMRLQAKPTGLTANEEPAQPPAPARRQKRVYFIDIVDE